MNVAILIPARYQSSRFPGKPLAKIAGKSMIQRVWEQCSKSALAHEVFVATDDARIADEVARFGGAAIMTPPELASGTERIAHASRELDADILINVQGDEPLIPPSTIDAVIEPLLTSAAIDISTAACPLADAGQIANPNVVKVVFDATYRALYFSRSTIPYMRNAAIGHLGPIHWKHIGIYGFRRESLARFCALSSPLIEQVEQLEQLRALYAGMHIHVAPVASDSVAVDVPADIDTVLAALEAAQS